MTTVQPLDLQHLQAWLDQSVDPCQRSMLIEQAVHHQVAASLMQSLTQHPQPHTSTLLLLRILRNLCAGNAPVAHTMLQDGVVNAIAHAAAKPNAPLLGDAALCKATAQLLCNAATTDAEVACAVWQSTWPHTLLAVLDHGMLSW